IEVVVEPVAMEAHALTVAGISNASRLSNARAVGGTILRGRYRFPLRTVAEFRSLQELGEVVVLETSTTSPGRARRGEGPLASVVLLKDVATVRDGFRERESIARHNGQEAVGILIFKAADA